MSVNINISPFDHTVMNTINRDSLSAAAILAVSNTFVDTVVVKICAVSVGKSADRLRKKS